MSGKTPSESNVYDDLVVLKSDYPENYLWDMTRSYTSKELGTATGVEAFAYMLSDKVFGAMAATIMGGLLVATLLTVCVLPVVYAIFYNIRKS